MENELLLSIIVPLSAIVGQLIHIVKKHTETAGSERAAFKTWVINRPANSIIAVVTAIAAAEMLQVDGATLMQGALTAFTAGFAANSAINRTK
jgi:hypothetical protein